MGYFILENTTDIVYIKDTGTGKSVTNTAEEVTEEVFNKYGNKRIIYRDTDGTWDELVHRSGEFVDFKLLNKNDSNYKE